MNMGNVNTQPEHRRGKKGGRRVGGAASGGNGTVIPGKQVSTLPTLQETKESEKTIENGTVTMEKLQITQSRRPADSTIEMLEVIRVEHCQDGRLLPGQLLKWMDICACLSAEAHAGKPSVTATVDDLQFVRPISCGQLLSIKAQVNRAFNTSMEVGVRVEIEDLYSGVREPCCSAYFVFVTLDKQKLPPMVPDTPDDVRRHALADERKKIRLSRKKTLDDFLIQQTSQSTTEEDLSSMEPSDEESVSPGDVAAPTPSPPSLEVSKATIVPMEPDRPVVQAASASLTRLTQLVLPPHANHMGNTFGGQVMEWAAEAANIAACRHARRPVVVASIDDIYFVSPSTVGDRIHVVAQVNRAFQTSFEVGIRAEAQGPDGGPLRVICRAYFTFVALASGTVKAVVPQVRAVSREEIRRYHKALGRRKIRLERRAISDDTVSTAVLAWHWIPQMADEYKMKNVDALLAVATEPVHWEKLHEVHGVSISMRERLSVQCFKLEARVSASPRQVADYIRDFDTRGEWDQLFTAGHVVVSLDGHNDISWLAIKDRDFALLRSWREDEVVPGRHILASRSVIHPAVPEKEGYIRAEVSSSGFIVSPVAGGKASSECDLVYIAQMGAKAMTLTMEDMFEKRKPLLDSFLALKKCLANLPKAEEP